MKINVTNLKYEINNFNKIIGDYESIYLNMYNEYSNSSFFWYDENAKNFFKDINLQKISMQKTFDEFSSLLDIYNYIASSYEELGKEIYYELSAQNEIKTNINNYVNKLQKIINQYNYLNLSKCPEVYNYIQEEKTKLNNALDNAKELYNKVKIFYKKIEEIEKEVKVKTSKIKVEYIKENHISDYV